MDNIKTLTRDNLRKLIEDTELTLAELKTELERREEAAQHREVANLDHHMRSAELNLKSIRDFLAYLTEEWRSNHSK
tara:strand:- start:111 stop:341 length:231 start_codon:yes stop_codon:yes gene_type:complete